MAVMGGLALVGRAVPDGSEQAKWMATAREGADRIRDIVKRMNHITRIEEVPEQGTLPPMLDIKKSSSGTKTSSSTPS